MRRYEPTKYLKMQILRREGYTFGNKNNNKIEDIIVNSLLSSTCAVANLVYDVIQKITDHRASISKNKDFTMDYIYKIKSKRYFVSFINKYNLKKYYTKGINYYQTQDMIDNGDKHHHTMCRYYFNIDQIYHDDVIDLLSQKVAIRPYSETKMLSASLFDTIYEAINICNNEQTQDIINKKLILKEYLDIIGRRCMTNNQDRAFTIKQNGKMRYTPANKKVITNDVKWLTQYRSDIKYGKGLRKIFKDVLGYVTDNDIEKMANTISSKYKFDYTLQKISGKDILDGYHGENYANANTGTLSQSCMRHTGCQDFFGIYTDNSDTIEMLVAKDKNNKIHARALLWYNVMQKNNGIKKLKTMKVMDRIYGTDLAIQKFKEWATFNGFYYKRRQSYTDSTLISPIGEIVDSYESPMLIAPKNDMYPYMDTFKYATFTNADDDNRYLKLNNTQGDHTLESTEGNIRNEEYETELRCGSYVHEDDACYDEFNDDYIHRENAVWCEQDQTYCDEDDYIAVDDNYYHNDSELIRYSSYLGEYILNDYAVYSDTEESYLHIDDAIDCPVLGYVASSNTLDIEIGEDDVTEMYSNLVGDTYTIHESVSKEDLIEHLTS